MNNELTKGLREGLDACLLKQAGATELTDEQRQFIDLTVENMEKSAGLIEFLGQEKGFGSVVGKAVANTAVPLLGGLGVAAGAAAIQSIANGMNKSKFEAALRMAISRNPVLQHADQERVKSLAESIYSTEPHVSTDPNILGQVLANAVRGETLEIQHV